jgi:hypothetical protein
LAKLHVVLSAAPSLQMKESSLSVQQFFKIIWLKSAPFTHHNIICAPQQYDKFDALARGRTQATRAFPGGKLIRTT